MSGADKVVKVYWNTPNDILAITHGGVIPMDTIPPGIRSLAGTDAANQLVVMAQVRDEHGKIIGMLTEIEVFTEGQTEFEVYLTVVIPARGAIVVRETKNYANPAIMDAFERMQGDGDSWEGEIEVVQTTGPAAGNQGVVIAATGEFEGMTGFQQQVSIFRKMTPRMSHVDTVETFWLTSKI